MDVVQRGRASQCWGPERLTGGLAHNRDAMSPAARPYSFGLACVEPTIACLKQPSLRQVNVAKGKPELDPNAATCIRQTLRSRLTEPTSGKWITDMDEVQIPLTPTAKLRADRRACW